jgi:hypothetical protein
MTAYNAARNLEDMLISLPPSEESLKAVTQFNDRMTSLSTTSAKISFLSTAGSSFLLKRQARTCDCSIVLPWPVPHFDSYIALLGMVIHISDTS